MAVVGWSAGVGRFLSDLTEWSATKCYKMFQSDAASIIRDWIDYSDIAWGMCNADGELLEAAAFFEEGSMGFVPLMRRYGRCAVDLGQQGGVFDEGSHWIAAIAVENQFSSAYHVMVLGVRKDEGVSVISGEELLTFIRLIFPSMVSSWEGCLNHSLPFEEKIMPYHLDRASAVFNREGVIYQGVGCGLMTLLHDAWPDIRFGMVPKPLLRSLSSIRNGKTVDFKGVQVRLAPYGDVYALYIQRYNKLECLSGREREIAELLYSGMSYKEIAKNCSISSSTVTNHVNSIFRKLEISKSGQLSKFISADH